MRQAKWQLSINVSSPVQVNFEPKLERCLAESQRAAHTVNLNLRCREQEVHSLAERRPSRPLKLINLPPWCFFWTICGTLTIETESLLPQALQSCLEGNNRRKEWVNCLSAPRWGRGTDDAEQSAKHLHKYLPPPPRSLWACLVHFIWLLWQHFLHWTSG